MGRKLIEHTLPEIARQLERVADNMEKSNEELIRLQERYKTLSELDADPKSTHKLSKKVCAEMEKTLDLLKNKK
jgi:hypothetical protein